MKFSENTNDSEEANNRWYYRLYSIPSFTVGDEYRVETIYYLLVFELLMRSFLHSTYHQ